MALAVATRWIVTIGSDREVALTADTPDLPDLRAILGVCTCQRPCAIRLVRVGWLWLLVQPIQGRPLPTPHCLVSEPWPDLPPSDKTLIPHQKALSYVCM